MVLFPTSIGRDMYEGPQYCMNDNLLSNGTIRAILGAGHFVATFRREVFRFAPDKPSKKKVSGQSENKYLDVPVERAGLLRLGTSRILAHHMGNKFEPWHREVLERSRTNERAAYPQIRGRSLVRWIPQRVRRGLLNVLIEPYMKRMLARAQGLARNPLAAWISSNVRRTEVHIWH